MNKKLFILYIFLIVMIFGCALPDTRTNVNNPAITGFGTPFKVQYDTLNNSLVVLDKSKGIYIIPQTTLNGLLSDTQNIPVSPIIPNNSTVSGESTNSLYPIDMDIDSTAGQGYIYSIVAAYFNPGNGGSTNNWYYISKIKISDSTYTTKPLSFLSGNTNSYGARFIAVNPSGTTSGAIYLSRGSNNSNLSLRYIKNDLITGIGKDINKGGIVDTESIAVSNSGTSYIYLVSKDGTNQIWVFQDATANGALVDTGTRLLSGENTNINKIAVSSTYLCCATDNGLYVFTGADTASLSSSGKIFSFPSLKYLDTEYSGCTGLYVTGTTAYVSHFNPSTIPVSTEVAVIDLTNNSTSKKIVVNGLTTSFVVYNNKLISAVQWDGTSNSDGNVSITPLN